MPNRDRPGDTIRRASPPRSRETAYEKGLRGEAQARAYLEALGMRHVASRYRCPYGEIDLVMRSGDTLVFVEVKARARGASGDGLLAIDQRKRRRLAQSALCYLGERQLDCPARIDALEISAQGIRHVENAVEAAEAEDAAWNR